MLLRKIFSFLLIVIFFVVSCTPDSSSSATAPTKTTAKPAVKIPKFNRDSAYVFTEKQVAFGPRLPNTEGHRKCKDGMFKNLNSLMLKSLSKIFR